MATAKKLTSSEQANLLKTLQQRFEKNMHRHKSIAWKEVEARVLKNPSALVSLQAMESTGGEPDVVGFDKKEDEYLFFDCSLESPAGRRSLCYDRKALDGRKENKPKGAAMEEAAAMGIELLDEEQYRYLQQLGPVDTKTSSWLLTPAAIRKLEGSLFGDYRYATVFVYHNGASSYYAARGFRGCLRV